MYVPDLWVALGVIGIACLFGGTLGIAVMLIHVWRYDRRTDRARAERIAQDHWEPPVDWERTANP